MKTVTRLVKDQRIGRGIVIDPEIRVNVGIQNRRGARLLCDCGQTYEAPMMSLVTGAKGTAATKSCGCLAQEALHKPRNTKTHGLSEHPLYDTWQQMLARCYRPNSISYPDYGGRGIKVYESWHDVGFFIRYIESVLGARPSGMSLDRISNDGNYEPGNVRWATPSQQALNSRTSSRSTSGHRGIHWCKKSGKWQARIAYDGYRQNLGFYTTIDDAIKAYHQAVLSLFHSTIPCCQEVIS